MKTKIVLLFLLSMQFCAAQDSISVKTDSIKLAEMPSTDESPFKYFKWKSDKDKRIDSVKIFSLTPISRRVNKVNGFALGFGHFENSRIKFQKINGMNIELNPLSLALVSFSINVPFEAIFVGINDNSISNASFLYDDYPTAIQVNGLNISTGGFMGGAKMNGLNICIFSGMNEMNGLSITGVLLGTKRFSGVSISGIANMTDYGNGLQLGMSNISRNHHGVQIGLFNHSKNLRGVQFGLWNTNGKRKLPLINWQFKS